MNPFLLVLRKIFLVELGSAFFEFALRHTVIWGANRLAKSAKNELTVTLAKGVEDALTKPKL